MKKSSTNGYIRTFYNVAYKLLSVNENGVRRQRFEHRLIMEEHLGRKLLKDEIVHHKDGNGLNNSIHNLEIMSPTTHQQHHLSGLSWNLEEARHFRTQGWTINKIAQHFGVTYAAVNRGFRTRGISTTDLRWGKTKWDFSLAVNMYKTGKSFSEIARTVGVTPPSVRKAFLKYEIIKHTPRLPSA